MKIKMVHVLGLALLISISLNIYILQKNSEERAEHLKIKENLNSVFSVSKKEAETMQKNMDEILKQNWNSKKTEK